MHRCFELAQKGAGNVAPNPMVGAVLLYKNEIIGEGYHAQYGLAHAEVNCINNVPDEKKQFISASTLYVSLEPCAHYGKTPACADFIIAHKIPSVVIGCKDSFNKVDGKGIEKLKAAGVEVTCGILQAEATELNKRFFTFNTKKRPYIILKWAQTANGVTGVTGNNRLIISNSVTNRLVHKWRSEEAAILVGTHTALKDNPSLTTRLVTGNNPVRLVIDKQLILPASLQLFDNAAPTIIFNYKKNEERGKLRFYKIEQAGNILPQIMQALYTNNLQSVIVEGGAALLQSFIDSNLWDEARIITNTSLHITEGITAPVLLQQQSVTTATLQTDIIEYFKNGQPA
jgi:diaminohydroxyphosphoribosylaminopyrimidine deaminase/5-amino-6-(5-phosphoribosylamino)uracil reductase